MIGEKRGQHQRSKLGNYWSLIKSLQTGLLLFTGIAGYTSAQCPVGESSQIIGLSISLFLAIAGSTVLNMVWDRDIDSRMERTAHRPLVNGALQVNHALIFGIVISVVGLIVAYWLDPLYALIVGGGLFIDVGIYTMWLKRKTAWSIVWGGISGGMPILAGRVLAVGHIDGIGVLFLLSVLLWIPTHILTFNIRNFADYRKAGIPTFADRYGFMNTRWIIAASSVGASLAIGLGLYSLGLSWGYLKVLAILSTGLLVLATFIVFRPSEKHDFYLFKYASLYMMGAMSIISFSSF
ncbi:MAG: protoheme IX farnesyltransferase [Candidatus Marinimicrobia bacterium]|nr:protoheme IX farnesyltransferase [Candidatus Neomarinimicrobiota bacterium]